MSTPGESSVESGVEVLVQRLDPDIPLPDYAHEGDAGADLVSAIDVVLEPGQRATVPTGLAIALPVGYGGFVLPRSGLALKHGVTVVNAPGLIDSGYRGEVRVPLINTDPIEPYAVHRGDRIAQLVVQRVEAVRWIEADSLDGFDRQ